ncbi:TRAP transporter small permease [Ruegeria sp. AU67]|uniref:TRAP transporter small permease n=1 Tax=Ruegeria sp. AU67 TaxID=2108530 RepID=UPI000D68AC36|nr:TRAP transporter small permease subunit [Ruegeria sp. AU67]
MADIQKQKLRNPWYVVLHLPTWTAAGTLFVLMCMTFLDVVLRSAFDNPIESATELTRLFMAIIVFSALPLVSWKGENIVVDLLDPFFSERLAQMRDSLIDAICGIVLIWPAIRVWELAERARQYGDVTEYLKLPQFYVGWFISVFVALTAIAFLARSVVRLISKTEDTE